LISKDKSGSPAGRVASVLCGSDPRQVNGSSRWRKTRHLGSFRKGYLVIPGRWAGTGRRP